jgi:hypothetical protein
MFSQLKFDNNISEYKIESEKEFSQNSLWGYINGGADIYLEYGFEHLLVQEINFAGEKIKVEIYKMNSAKSAFGIFSLYYKNSDQKYKGIDFSSISKYHVQAALGNYYLSIINSSGSEEAKTKSIRILEILHEGFSESDFILQGFILNMWLMKPEINIKLLKSKLSFENYAMEYEYFADKSPDTDKYYISFRTDEKNISMLYISNITLKDFTMNLGNKEFAEKINDDSSLSIVVEHRLITIKSFEDNSLIVYRSIEDYTEFLKLLNK